MDGDYNVEMEINMWMETHSTGFPMILRVNSGEIIFAGAVTNHARDWQDGGRFFPPRRPLTTRTLLFRREISRTAF